MNLCRDVPAVPDVPTQHMGVRRPSGGAANRSGKLQRHSVLLTHALLRPLTLMLACIWLVTLHTIPHLT